jgi:hypothetical protein
LSSEICAIHALLHAYTTLFECSSDEISSIQITRSNLKIINYLTQLLFYCKGGFWGFGEGTRLAFNLSFTVVLLYETTIPTTIAVEVLGAVNELCDTVKRDARIPCTYRAFSTTRNHIVTGLAACFRHVETLVALASASVSVRLLIGCTDSTNASAALDRQKIRSTHRADIGRSALLAAAHDRAATLTLALIQVVPRQTLSAASPIRALARHASLDHLA